MAIYMNNQNHRAFYDMLGHIENVESMLSKSIVSNSPKQRMMIFSDIWQQAYSAKENLTQLPVSDPSTTRTSRFLTQTGDFAWTLAKKYARGQALKPEDTKKLNDLHTQAGYLAVELQKIQKETGGSLTWGTIPGNVDRNLKTKTPSVPQGMVKIDKNMQGFPTLIYDGPFSDHILNRTPKGLTGSNITGKRAADIAKAFVEAGSAIKYKVVKTDTVKGTIPAFRIHLAPQNARTPLVVADISKKGGHILSMLSSRAVNQTRISKNRAITIAANFLSGRGFKNMQPTYMLEQRNTGVVIFEYTQNGVLIYPDLMKVKVALDTGEIVGYEGTAFVMNHHQRNIPKPKITEKKARTAVNPDIKIQSERLAIIPLENLQEVQAYEFRGDLKGDTFIVYVNAQTGEEERILKVIDTNSGPVTL